MARRRADGHGAVRGVGSAAGHRQQRQRARGTPYLAVGAGACLTHAYDRAADDPQVLVWLDAEQVNPNVRRPEFAPVTATRRHAGQDLSVLCTVTAEQRRAVAAGAGPDGRPAMTVIVGAVAVEVQITALGCHLTA